MILYVVLWIAYGIMAAILAANLVYLRVAGRRRGTAAMRRVSVLIPARDEERNLRRLLPSLLAQQDVTFDVTVYDDGSSDRTAAVVEELNDRRVTLLRGTGPPAGWVGKVHALYQASRDAAGDVYLFLDADTRFEDDRALSRMAARHASLPPRSVLTALPRFSGGGALLVSGIPHALLVALPLPIVPLARSRKFAAMNGQCWVIERETYHELEPHLEHRGEILEDVTIGRFLASRGVVPYFADLQDDLEVFMYGSLGEAWRGFRKNTYPMMGGRPVPFVLLSAWFGLTYVAAPLISAWFLVPIYLGKLACDRFARFPWWVSVLAPISFALWAVLHWDSAVSHWRGRVQWKGRDVVGRPDYGSDRGTQ